MASYTAALQTFATEIGQHLQPSGATVPPAPAGPLATSPDCGPPRGTSGNGPRKGGCSAAGGRPGASAPLIAALALIRSRRRRRA